jgi:hypothetical protein
MARIVPSLAVAVIDRLFPHSSSLGRGSMYEEAAIPKLRAVIELVKEIPTELLSLRAEDYSALVISTASINATLEHWPESAYRQTFEIDELDPISLIRHVLAQCPDEFPSPSTAELAFLTDIGLRGSIRQDVSTSNQALNNGEWKAATVLAGAAIEALLLWGTQHPTKQRGLPAAVAAVVRRGVLPPNRQNQPLRWDLQQLIDVAGELKLIEEETRTAALLAKDFRNLIHPGRAVREKLTCDRGTALSAVAALEHVVRDLTKHFGGQLSPGPP